MHTPRTVGNTSRAVWCCQRGVDAYPDIWTNGAARSSDGPIEFVTRNMVMSETLPLAEVKAKLSEMVDRVEPTHDRITLTRNGRPAAVLISPDELASGRGDPRSSL
jgi:prevent-host-death family protein